MSETQHASNLESVKKRGVMRTPDGRELPAGRQKGATSKVTRTIKDAIEMASHGCHPQGLAGWLIDRANGGVQDRQIFAGMVSKALPLQVHAKVDGGIRLELGWLSGRQVGASAAQIPGKQQQVIDLQPESDGMYRIVNPEQQSEPVQQAALAGDEAAAVPASPGHRG